MAWLPIALKFAGVALSVASAVKQGQAANQQASFQADVQEQQASRERQIAGNEERDFNKRQSALQAQRRAELGGAGVRGSTGTPLIASEDFLNESELQSKRIRAGGQIGATRLEQGAGLTRAAGKSAQQRGFFRAGSSLLSGIGSFS